MDLRSSDETIRRDIPSFIEARPPLIHNPFSRPRPQKGINLFEKFEDSDIEEPDLVQVYLRIKPCKVPNNLYELRSDKCLVTSLDTTTAGHGRRTQHNVSKMYSFSRIFKPECNQKEIFEQVVKGNLKKLIDGHSFTLLTYGASGSGKTYTVMGTVKSPGLVPRSLEYLFKLVDASQTPVYKPSDCGTDSLSYPRQELELQWVKRLLQVSAPFRDKYRRMSAQLHSDLTISSLDLTNRSKHYVWVSFVEIYNEAIYDLLAPPDKRAKLRLREDSAGNVFVKGVTQAFVRSGEEAFDVMVAGKHNLMVAATGIHAQSSRSHCIFTITMLTEKDGEIRTSHVRLCDLAGCERQRSARNTGTRMQESKAINSSLHVLERCLHALRKKQLSNNSAVVPYRECKLTRLLGSGLSGARGEAVTMVVTINPAPQYAHETKHVLSLAVVAKDIQINVTVDPTVTTMSSLECTQDSTMQDYSDELLRLRTENERLHFELLQAQSCNTQLRRAIEEKQQQSAATMSELVEETENMMRDYYEKRHKALEAQMKAMQDEYENRIADLTEEKLRFEKHVLSEKTEMQDLRKSIKNSEKYEQKESITVDPAHTSDIHPDPEYSSCSENESDSEDLDESLEPVRQIRKSMMKGELPKKHEAVIDLIDESSEEESDDEESRNETNSDNCDESKSKESVVPKQSLSCHYDPKTEPKSSLEHHSHPKTNDSLYLTDEDISEMEDEQNNIQSKSVANLTVSVTKESVKDVSFNIEFDKNGLEDTNTDKDKSECEELFNVSTKLNKTVEVLQKDVIPNVRGTYFVRNEPKGDCDVDDQKFKALNTVRGTYFVAERALSFYKETDFGNNCVEIQESAVENQESAVENKELPVKIKETVVINKESPVKNKELLVINQEYLTKNKESPLQNNKSSTEPVMPKKMAVAQVNKILKSAKNRQSSGSSLAQFEQLELAVNSADKSTHVVKTVDIMIPTQISKGKTYFNDTKEALNTTIEINKVTNEPTDGTKGNNNTKLKYFQDRFNESKLCQLSDAAKTQEKKLLFDSPETSTTSSEKNNKSIYLETNENIQSLILTPQIVRIKEAQLYYTENDKIIHNDVLLSKSPSIITDDITEEYKPSIALKKVLGESFTKPEILSSIRKERLAKKHESVDIFDSPLTSTTKASSKEISNIEITATRYAEEPIDKIDSELVPIIPIKNKANEIAHEFVESLVASQKIKAYIQQEELASAMIQVTQESETNDVRCNKNTIEIANVIKEESLEITSVIEQSTTVNTINDDKNINDSNYKVTNDQIRVKFTQPLNDSQTSKGNNTVDEFENIVKDLTNVRATDFELLVSEEDIAATEKIKLTQGIDTNLKETMEVTEHTKKFEDVKYNLRNKGKSILNVSDEAQYKQTEQSVESSKTKSTTKRCLRLRRRNNFDEGDTNQYNEKLKDIMNLRNEFSDVTLGLPAVNKAVKDIVSPDKLPGEEENVPPMMGIQSCPSKSVTRSRRKLFTPRAEPLEESSSQTGDSNERVYVPRPSYHRPKARARRKL